ncbi:MAG: hypothetical protein HY985_17505 [Magnetospirillum sp.]|nr:hypothetical protein [Magnetospirillum sp.]
MTRQTGTSSPLDPPGIAAGSSRLPDGRTANGRAANGRAALDIASIDDALDEIGPIVVNPPGFDAPPPKPQTRAPLDIDALLADDDDDLDSAAPATAAEDDDEPLILDESMEVHDDLPVFDIDSFLTEAAPALPVAEPEDEELVLDASMEVLRPSPAVEAVAAAAVGEPAAPPARPVTPPPPAPDPAGLLGRIDALAPGKGDPALPERTDALAARLDPTLPATDFAALDLLYACWPRTGGNFASRALHAVAVNLSRSFGLPGKLPMATSKAWRLLDPIAYEDALAHRLSVTAEFVLGWHRTQNTFLVLEFSEIELIEYLFETLHPGRHLPLLASVMNFKVLSNRRLGLLRRIPGRMRKTIQPMVVDDRDGALRYLAHTKALLEAIADPNGFAPIVDAANKAAAEIEKVMKLVAGAGAPALPAAGGGMALGRIG